MTDVHKKSMQHWQLAECFDRCFYVDHSTRMQGGADEPYFQPPTDHREGIIYYRDDFAASVLHEAAHWCIAGSARRNQADFGYAYIPPPRSEQQQAAFLAAELRTQTLELIFARSCGIEFTASVDNHTAGDQNSTIKSFTENILSNVGNVEAWLEGSAGSRARKFLLALGKLSRT